MKITQIRNATMILQYKENKILLDPMLAPQGTIPRLRYFASTRKNPLTDLPDMFKKNLQITHGLITHCQKGHFDHLDRAGIKFLRTSQLTVFCSQHDNAFLSAKGLLTQSFTKPINSFFDGSIQLIKAQHARGFLFNFMEHGYGYFIKLPNEPSLYIMGDSVLTDEIRDFVLAEQPDIIIAATGKAQFDFGGPILMNENEIVELAKISKGKIIANHMDALDHCRITRENLKSLIHDHNLVDKFLIPDDGETITF